MYVTIMKRRDISPCIMVKESYGGARVLTVMYFFRTLHRRGLCCLYEVKGGVGY